MNPQPALRLLKSGQREDEEKLLSEHQLSPLEREVLKVWRQESPDLVAGLQKQGQLLESVRAAVDSYLQERSRLVSRLVKQGQESLYAQLVARETLLPELLKPLPEPPESQNPEAPPNPRPPTTGSPTTHS